MLDCREGVLFFEGFILFSVNIEMMCFTKKLEFGLICPQDILPEGFWLVQVCFGKFQSGFLMSLSAVGSSWVSYRKPPFIELAMDGAS